MFGSTRSTPAPAGLQSNPGLCSMGLLQRQRMLDYLEEHPHWRGRRSVFKMPTRPPSDEFLFQCSNPGYLFYRETENMYPPWPAIP